MKGAHIVAYMKSITSIPIGADPLAINLILPPKAAAVLLNTNGSYNLWVQEPSFLTFSNFS